MNRQNYKNVEPDQKIKKDKETTTTTTSEAEAKKVREEKPSYSFLVLCFLCLKLYYVSVERSRVVQLL